MIKGVQEDTYGERKYWIAIPKKHEIERIIRKNSNTKGRGFKEVKGQYEYYRMPDDVYDNKDYPTCPTCKRKHVPIGNYKRCFRCRFTS